MENNIVLYQSENGAVELRADIEKDTVWATQEQIAQLFEVTIPTINEHLKNIFESNELAEVSTIRKFRIVQNEGKRKVNRDTNCYNLDAIIAVGYRVNSKKATQFRIWATGILRDHLKNGYTLNKYKLDKSPEALMDLYTAMSLIESKGLGGKLRGKVTFKLTQDFESK